MQYTTFGKSVLTAILLALPVTAAFAQDTTAVAERIKAAGGTLLSEPADRPWGARMFQFTDPDGFKLGASTPLAG